MAGYALKTADVNISTASAYSTETNLLTVGAGKICLIKGIEIIGACRTTGTSTTGGLTIQISDTTGTWWTNIAPTIAGTDSMNTNCRQWFQYAVDPALVTDALPASLTTTSTEYLPQKGQTEYGHNLKLMEGQIVRFTPLDSSGSGLNSTTIDLDFDVILHYNEYTQ